MNMIYDAVIIGAGPAGCAAAISLRQEGFSILVLDKPKKKIDEGEHPSESIHPGVETVLTKLNAVHCINNASRGIYKGVQSGSDYTALGSDDTGAWTGNHICRKKFDQELLGCVEKEGADISQTDSLQSLMIENDRVVGIRTEQGEIISCKYLIDASGYKSVAGKKLNLKAQYLSPNLFTWTGVSYSDKAHSVFEDKVAKFIPHKNGWTWLAPEPANRCTWTRLSVKGKQSLHPPQELEDFTMVGRVKTANRRWRIFRPLYKRGVLLCGDAGGIIDPAAGQGILNALVSGIMAAKTVIAIAKKPTEEEFFLVSYDNWFYRNYIDKVVKLREYYAVHGIDVFTAAHKV